MIKVPSITAKSVRTQQGEGECCIRGCNNEAIYYDSSNYGYCQSHWTGGLLNPGQVCAELFFKGSQPHWVRGTVIFDEKTFPYAFKQKKLKGLDFIYTYRESTHKPVQTLKQYLLPIRAGMPKVKLWDWNEVFDKVVYYPEKMKRTEIVVNWEDYQEDRDEEQELLSFDSLSRDIDE